MCCFRARYVLLESASFVFLLQEAELPNTQFGPMALLYVKQVGPRALTRTHATGGSTCARKPRARWASRGTRLLGVAYIRSGRCELAGCCT